MDVNYFDGQHVATNTINHQQIVDSAELRKDNILELVDNDISEKSGKNMEQYIQYNEELEMIPEESDEDLLVTAQGDGDEGDTILYIQGDSEDEQFNTAIDDTSDDPMIVMGKPLTTAFVSVNVCVPTEKVGCLQVTNQFLIHFPPESKEKAFEQIYKILQVLNAYLIDNPRQHIHCMSPDNEYVSIIMYAITIKIDLCNFLAIWAVLSILLDTQSNTLQHVKGFQQVVNNYYDKCPTDMMSGLEQQASIIMKAMYDSINNDHFDSISGDIDRVSGAVDSDHDANDYDKDEHVMPYDKDEHVMPYDKDEHVMPYDKDEHVMPYDKECKMLFTGFRPPDCARYFWPVSLHAFYWFLSTGLCPILLASFSACFLLVFVHQIVPDTFGWFLCMLFTGFHPPDCALYFWPVSLHAFYWFLSTGLCLILLASFSAVC